MLQGIKSPNESTSSVVNRGSTISLTSTIKPTLRTLLVNGKEGWWCRLLLGGKLLVHSLVVPVLISFLTAWLVLVKLYEYLFFFRYNFSCCLKVLLPLDALKIKRQVNPEAFRGRGVVRIFLEEGTTLYRGWGWTMARNAPGSFAVCPNFFVCGLTTAFTWPISLLFLALRCFCGD